MPTDLAIQRDEVQIVNICSLNLSDNWETACEEMQAWCDANNASYYGAPRESFSREKAISLAIREGNSIVVVEDLS